MDNCGEINEELETYRQRERARINKLNKEREELIEEVDQAIEKLKAVSKAARRISDEL